MDYYRKNKLVPISVQEFQNNVNTKYGIHMGVQKQLLNGNAQFIIDMCKYLKM